MCDNLRGKISIIKLFSPKKTYVIRDFVREAIVMTYFSETRLRLRVFSFRETIYNTYLTLQILTFEQLV